MSKEVKYGQDLFDTMFEDDIVLLYNDFQVKRLGG